MLVYLGFFSTSNTDQQHQLNSSQNQRCTSIHIFVKMTFSANFPNQDVTALLPLEQRFSNCGAGAGALQGGCRLHEKDNHARDNVA